MFKEHWVLLIPTSNKNDFSGEYGHTILVVKFSWEMHILIVVFFKVNLKCHGLENYKIPDASYAYTTCKQTPNTSSGLAGYEVTKQTFNSFL